MVTRLLLPAAPATWMTCMHVLSLQGGEFDAVKLLMEAVLVSGTRCTWFHLNFWARSRSANKIKRFFAEVHYKPSSDSDDATIKYPPLPSSKYMYVHFRASLTPFYYYICFSS